MKEFPVRQVFILDYSDFDDLTKEVYGRKYDFVPSEEANNDSSYYYSNVVAEPLDEYEANELLKFQNKVSDVNWFAGSLLQDMCFKKVIPPGNYLIQVCW